MEQEINIIEWINVFVKRKRIIIFFFILAFLLSLAFVLTFFDVKKGSMVLEIGGYFNKEKNIKSPLESQAEISFFVSKLPYGGVSSSYDPDSHFLTLETAGTGSSKELQSNLAAVSAEIIKHHAELETARKELIQKKIERIEQTINETNIRNGDSGIFQMEILNLLDYKENISSTREIKEPSIQQKSYNSYFFYLFTGSLLGILAGMFAAFLFDWWSKNKDRIIIKNE